MDVRLRAIPADELPALLAESMSLPPIDLTLPTASYANLAVYALFPTPRDNYDAVKSALPDTALTPTLHQFPLLRRPLLPAGRLATARIGPPLPPATFTWATALRSQKFGFYVLRRSKPVFPDFESVTPAPRTTPAPTTTRPS